MATKTLTMEVDDDDERDILAAIELHTAINIKAFGEPLLPEGDSDDRGTTLGEICRDWMERHALGMSE